MPVPKRKRSRARRDSRLAHQAIKVKSVAACPNCQAPIASHQACRECGMYKGVKVFKTKVDRSLSRGHTAEMIRKKKEARAATQQHEEKSE